jgi:hypothetical protein
MLPKELLQLVTAALEPAPPQDPVAVEPEMVFPPWPDGLLPPPPLPPNILPGTNNFLQKLLSLFDDLFKISITVYLSVYV